jgi:hypothetical protein
MLVAMKTTSKVRATNSPKLTPQAQQIADIVSRVGPLDQDTLIEKMRSQVHTKKKKPMTREQAGRLLSYYKSRLISGGLVTLQFAAGDGLRRKQSKCN